MDSTVNSDESEYCELRRTPEDRNQMSPVYAPLNAESQTQVHILIMIMLSNL